MKIFKTLVFTILFFIAIVFAVENNTTISITFYGLGGIDLPLFILVFVSVFIGIIIAGTIWTLEGVKTRMEIGRLKKKNKEYENELNTLRNLPLSDSPDSPKGENV
jgi:uncharacterized integral membrane protein